MKVEVEGNKYKVIKNVRDAFDKEIFIEKCTDYFYTFDYIVGDWAYGKLRLKGFYNKNNKSVNDINNYENVDKYIELNCAYGCKYFILEKE